MAVPGRAIGCFATIVLVMVLGWYGSRLPKSETDARLEIEHYVSQSLKNPDAAKFPRDRQSIVKTGERRFRGAGVVYSTNGFNAVVPESYICEVEFVGEDKVLIHHLQIGEEVVYHRPEGDPSPAPAFKPIPSRVAPTQHVPVDQALGSDPPYSSNSPSHPRRFQRQDRTPRRSPPLERTTPKVPEVPARIPLATFNENGLSITARLAPLGDGKLGGNLEGFAFHQFRSWPAITLRYQLLSQSRPVDVVNVVIRNVQQEIRQTFQAPYRTPNVTGARLVQAVACPRPVPDPLLVGDDGFWISDQGSVRIQLGSFPPGAGDIPCLINSDRIYEKVVVDVDLFDIEGRFIQTTRGVVLNVEAGRPKRSSIPNPNPRTAYYRFRGISGKEFKF